MAGRRAIIRNSKEIGGGTDVCEEGDPVRFVRFRFLPLISNLFTTRSSSRITSTLHDMGYTEENAKQSRYLLLSLVARPLRIYHRCLSRNGELCAPFFPSFHSFVALSVVISGEEEAARPNGPEAFSNESLNRGHLSS